MTEVDSTPVLDSEEVKFLQLINDYRSKNNVAPLQISASLTRAANWLSTDMSTKGYVSHTDSTGRDPFQRMRDYGYTYRTYLGENIAAGVQTADEALDGWINECDPNSSGRCTYAHNANMLNPNFNVVGLKRVNDPNSTYKWYWTTDFGGVVDEIIPVNPTVILSAKKSPRGLGRQSPRGNIFSNVPIEKPVYLAISFQPETRAWLARNWFWILLLILAIMFILYLLFSKRGPNPQYSYRYY